MERRRVRVVDELAHPVLDPVDHRAARDESESVTVDDPRGVDEFRSRVAGPIRVDPIEAVDPAGLARPPEEVAIDRRPRCLHANDRAHVAGRTADVTDDDLGVLVVWDGRRRVRSPVMAHGVAARRFGGKSSVVLLKVTAVSLEGCEPDPGAPL